MNFLYALDAKTGKPIAGFGEEGRVDLRKDLRGDFKPAIRFILDSPGIVYKDLIIVGGEEPESLPAPPGDIRAFDVHTGALRWTFHTIPHPGEPGYETWPADAWKTSGAANNWAGHVSGREARHRVRAYGVSGIGFLRRQIRLGNDLFANTLLALDAETGKVIWYFQGVHHDLWDRDFPSPPALLTVEHDGKQIDAIAQIDQDRGICFFSTARTGKPLFPIEERNYPPSTVPGEAASPTQPFPTIPKPFARQLLTEDMLTNRTPEAHEYAAENIQDLSQRGAICAFRSGQADGRLSPDSMGSAEWGGPAVDPKTRVIYINSNELAWTGGLESNAGGVRDPGAAIYRSRCGLCHGDDMTGSPPGFPSLVNIGNRLSDEEIKDTIRQGKAECRRFPSLTEEQRTALVNFLEGGNPNPPSASNAGPAAGGSAAAGPPAAAARPTTDIVLPATPGSWIPMDIRPLRRRGER